MTDAPRPERPDLAEIQRRWRLDLPRHGDFVHDLNALIAYALRLEREQGELREIAEAAIAFRAADRVRMAHLRGCVMPDPVPAWVAARDRYRRATDAALASRSPEADHAAD